MGTTCDNCRGVHEEDHDPTVVLCGKHAATDEILDALRGLVRVLDVAPNLRMNFSNEVEGAARAAIAKAA
ncbi:MAG: hypothetical protein ACRD3I_08715 [Terriglobales bacterium]